MRQSRPHRLENAEGELVDTCQHQHPGKRGRCKHWKRQMPASGIGHAHGTQRLRPAGRRYRLSGNRNRPLPTIGRTNDQGADRSVGSRRNRDPLPQRQQDLHHQGPHAHAGSKNTALPPIGGKEPFRPSGPGEEPILPSVCGNTPPRLPFQATVTVTTKQRAQTPGWDRRTLHGSNIARFLSACLAKTGKLPWEYCPLTDRPSTDRSHPAARATFGDGVAACRERPTFNRSTQ